MNKVLLIGKVDKEPDVRYYAPGQATARVTLTTMGRGATKADGTEAPPHTDRHNLLFARQLAAIVERYVHAGDKLFVEGRLRYNAYEDKFGKSHFITEIMVENMELLTPQKV